MIYFLVAQSCTSSKVLVKEFDTNAYDILLQESKGRTRFIFLKKDTAYYERHQLDKPGYFTDFDTLVRSNICSCYKGKNTYISLTEKNISLKFFDGRDKGKIFQFSMASDEQVKKWGQLKKSEKFYREQGFNFPN